ncbi:MAG TPA: TonB-dependent receptor plug domain-containing protein, partial [Myxococcales bacterium]|nr:TonB-dependent receptor plug domain-containing protein [Myxococcales bacterium]
MMKPAAFAVSALFLATAAAAQEAAPSPTTPPNQETTAPTSAPPTPAPASATGGKKSAEEEIVVTGSRIRRKDLTTPAPVTVVTREQFEQSGKATIGDFLQSMPEQGNAPNFQLNTGGINYGADGATRINLRSLGVQRTLVLINGRRVVPAGLGASAAVDLNTIPTEAVDHVEILKDGGSAVYGSDAVAGVVNIITRRSYNGTQVGADYGISQRGDAQTFDAHVTSGFSDEAKSAMFSVRYFNQKDSWLRDRDWSQQALDNDYTGGGPGFSGSSRVPQGALRIPEDPNNLGHPDCRGNAFCIQMTSQLGWSPTQRYIRNSSSGDGSVCTTIAGQQDCFRNFNTPAADNGGSGNDFYNYAAENYLTIPTTSLQAFSSGDVKWSAVRGYYEASYVQRNTTQNAAPMPLNPGDYNNIVYSANSIYNPFGTDLSFLGRRLVEFGDRTYSEELGTFRVVTGLDGTLPEQFGPLHGWYWDANMNYGKTSGTFITGGSFRNSRVQSATGPSMIDPATGQPVCVSTPGDIKTVIDGCTPLNLLGGPGSIAPSQQDYLGFSGTSRAFDALFSVGVNATGDLFTIAADRPASLAIGYEFRRQSGAQVADPIVQSGDSADFNFKSTNGFFTVHEAYAELSLPLLANIPGVEALEF